MHLLQNQYSASRRMGDILVDILIDKNLEILNDGSPTYHSTNSSSALDITACKGDMPTSWRVVDDDIRSDHSAILIQLGRDGPIERVCIKDWSKMNW